MRTAAPVMQKKQTRSTMDDACGYASIVVPWFLLFTTVLHSTFQHRPFSHPHQHAAIFRTLISAEERAAEALARVSSQDRKIRFPKTEVYQVK